MPRFLTKSERDLVSFILGRNAPENLLAEEMSDGGMGGLRFVSQKLDRKFGGCLGKAQFKDVDGTPVLVALNSDQDGDLFELDLWRVDFLPVNKIAAFEDLRPSD